MLDLDYAELNKELGERVQILSNTAKKIADRFHYRTMINRSYTLQESNKIEMEIENKLREIEKEIASL